MAKDDHQATKEFRLPEPNPVTRAAHQLDFFRQVVLPLILVLLLSSALAVVFILLPVGDVETWSQISTIFLIGLAMVIGLLLLAMLSVLVYLVTSLLRVLPPYTRLAQDALVKIRDAASKGADIPVKPIIQIQSFISAINALFGRDSR